MVKSCKHTRDVCETLMPWAPPLDIHYRVQKPSLWAVYTMGSKYGNEIDLLNLKSIGAIYWYYLRCINLSSMMFCLS